MKNFIVAIIILCLIQQAKAQSIGIGTNTPNASAVIDITSVNKGILFPRVYLQSPIDVTTIPAPATSLHVYNTNPNLAGGRGLFYNNGTPASPSWQKVGNLVMPYYYGTTENTSAFQIDNYSATTNSSAIKGYGGGQGIGISGIGNGGTGVYAKSTAGNALETDGKLKFAGTGQTPGTGKVLTSDINGNATWQGAIAFSSSGVVYGNDKVAPYVISKVAFLTENYDLSNNYNDANATPRSTFISPQHGIYHFDVMLTYYSPEVNAPTVYLKLKRAGVESFLAIYISRTQSSHSIELIINKDVELISGDEISVWTLHQSDVIKALESDATAASFSGRQVIKL